MTEQDGEMLAESGFPSLRQTSQTNEIKEEPSGINAEQKWPKKHLFNAKPVKDPSLQELDLTAIQDGTKDKIINSSHLMRWRTVIIGNDGQS